LVGVLKGRALVVLLAATLGAAGTARLGFWQLDRAAQKIEIQTALAVRRALPPLPVDELVSAKAQDAARIAQQHHRLITLSGHWLGERTIYLENRQMNDVPGFYAVTPLLLADGTAVLVQRGWLPRDPAERARISAPPPPAGLVQVNGRIAPAPGRLFEFDKAASGVIRQNLEIHAFARETGLVLRPVSVVQEDGNAPTPDGLNQAGPPKDGLNQAGPPKDGLNQAGPPKDGLKRQWPQPASGVEKHHGYAFQWFALSALITGLYVWFQLIRPRIHRARPSPV
jgi:surfeit locus 1 family protein